MRRVLHVIGSMAAERGGPPSAVMAWAPGLQPLGWSADIVTTSRGSQNDLTFAAGVRKFCFPRTDNIWKFSPGLLSWLRANAKHYDVLHLHGLFEFTTVAAAAIAKRYARPYLVSPHGVLNEWGMMNRKVRLKRAFLRTVDGFVLNNSGTIHFASADESRQAHEAFPIKFHDIVPYAVKQSPVARAVARLRIRRTYPQVGNRRTVIFVSRGHAKKGLEMLLPAFSMVRKQVPELALIVAGLSDCAEVAKFEALRDRLGLSAEDAFSTGFVTGTDKWTLFSAGDVFCLPSFCESFGIAVVEAMACGTPVVVTDRIPVCEAVSRYGAGEVVGSIQPNAIAKALLALLTDSSRWEQASAGCVAAAEEEFDYASACARMSATYDRLVGGGARWISRPAATTTATGWLGGPCLIGDAHSARFHTNGSIAALCRIGTAAKLRRSRVGSEQKMDRPIPN